MQERAYVLPTFRNEIEILRIGVVRQKLPPRHLHVRLVPDGPIVRRHFAQNVTGGAVHVRIWGPGVARVRGETVLGRARVMQALKESWPVLILDIEVVPEGTLETHHVVVHPQAAQVNRDRATFVRELEVPRATDGRIAIYAGSRPQRSAPPAKPQAQRRWRGR